MLSKINANTYMLELFVNHEIDAPVFAQDISTIGYEIDPPIDESGPTDNDAQFPDVNEVAEDDEVESNDPEDDVAGRSNEDDDACNAPKIPYNFYNNFIIYSRYELSQTWAFPGNLIN